MAHIRVSIVALAAAWSVPAAALAAGTWVEAGSMSTARFGHTATLLGNGSVLVAGGIGAQGAALAAAEIYNPANGRWTVTGSMNRGRAYHTATLLQDGVVLVTGGQGAGATAEVYDPSTGRWAAAGTMSQARSHHAAVALGNGQVLVAGGVGSSGAELAGAEIFDPATGEWSPTGSMNYPRASSAATLLPGGGVLIAGGDEVSSAAGHSAEIYLGGQWKPTASMSSERSGDTAATLTGGNILVFGGGPLAGGEWYDAGTAQWNATDGFGASPPVQGQSETLLGDGGSGEVLVVGGVDRYHDTGAVAHLYSPSTNRWQSTAALHQARSQHTATLLDNGQVLVTGGELTSGSASTALASAELYMP